MGFVANMKIGKRLGLGFALILAMTMVIAAVGAWRMTEVATSTKAMMAVPLAKERLITDWYSLNYASIRRTAAIVKSTDTSLGAYFKDDSAASVKRAAVRVRARNCSMNAVLSLPATKSGSLRIFRCSGIDVLIPSITVISSVRRMREIASWRSRPCTMIFAIIES